VSAWSVPPGRARTLRTHPIRQLPAPPPGQATDPTSLGFSARALAPTQDLSHPAAYVANNPASVGRQRGARRGLGSRGSRGDGHTAGPICHGCRWDCHDSRPGQPVVAAVQDRRGLYRPSWRRPRQRIAAMIATAGAAIAHCLTAAAARAATAATAGTAGARRGGDH
jgi:hypothetical protein